MATCTGSVGGSRRRVACSVVRTVDGCLDNSGPCRGNVGAMHGKRCRSRFRPGGDGQPAAQMAGNWQMAADNKSVADFLAVASISNQPPENIFVVAAAAACDDRCALVHSTDTRRAVSIPRRRGHDNRIFLLLTIGALTEHTFARLRRKHVVSGVMMAQPRFACLCLYATRCYTSEQTLHFTNA